MDKKPPKMHFTTSQQTGEKEKPVTAGQAIKRGSFGRLGFSSTTTDAQNSTPAFDTTNIGGGRSSRIGSSGDRKQSNKSAFSFGQLGMRKRGNVSDENDEDLTDPSQRVSQRQGYTHFSKNNANSPRTLFKSKQSKETTKDVARGTGMSSRDKTYPGDYLKKQKIEQKKMEQQLLEEKKIAQERYEKKKEADARGRALYLQEQMFIWKSKANTNEFAPEVVAAQLRVIEMEYFSIDRRFRPW